LLDFGARSAHQAPLIFISSVSTAQGWSESHPNEEVPEEVLDDFDAPERLGYAESKFICEHLIQEFSTSSGISSVIMHVGQIAGPLKETGIWNKNEWLPSIITSSKHLGILPQSLVSLEVIDWIPVDVLASKIVELVQNNLNQMGSNTKVYNLVNPRSTTWSALAPYVQTLTGITRMVGLREWVEILDNSSHERNGAIIEANPALRLLDFMRGISLKENPSNPRLMYQVGGLSRDSQRAAELTEVTEQ